MTTIKLTRDEMIAAITELSTMMELPTAVIQRKIARSDDELLKTLGCMKELLLEEDIISEETKIIISKI